MVQLLQAHSMVSKKLGLILQTKKKKRREKEKKVIYNNQIQSMNKK